MSIVHSKHVSYCVDGIVLLDKPKGVSSNHALQSVKRLLQAKKAGHTGSLDPLATGMLPICLGQATKFSQYLLNADKRYRVVIQLGIRTTTSDSEGEIVSQKDVPALSRAGLDESLNAFRGDVVQVPSMYSALKHQGTPLYKLARQGITVDRPGRPISIYENTLIELSDNKVTLDIHCSKGTYIRTIADDWGELLGCGAHVVELRRTHVGSYDSSAMVDLPFIEQSCNVDRSLFLQNHMLDLSSTVGHFPRCELSASDVRALQRGQELERKADDITAIMSLYCSGEFVGVGEAIDNKLRVLRLLSF